MGQEPDWYFVGDGGAEGPISVSEVVQHVRSRAFSRATLIWHEGMPDWAPLSKTEFAVLVEPERLDETVPRTSSRYSGRELYASCLRWLKRRAITFSRRWSWRATAGVLQGGLVMALACHVLLSLLPVATRSRSLRTELAAIASRASMTSDTALRSYVCVALTRLGLNEDRCEIELERRHGVFTIHLRYVEQVSLFGARLALEREQTVSSPTFESLHEVRQ